ncbi:MAG: hypothetical protein Q8N77_05290 [Nanoarchaeota archaeon]|nr:hypothetical protein [Nanoarchaeota archaeon]
MMKKGASHVDWAIGTGLFVVFIMLTLIALRPGTEPIYKGDVLLKIIEDGLEGDTNYTIEKQLLSINSLASCTTDKCKIRIREASKKGLNSKWVKDAASRSYVAMINDSQTKYNEETITFDVENEYCCASDCGSYYDEDCKPGGNVYVLDFKTYLKPGKNVFYLLYSDDFTYGTYTGVFNDLTDTPPPWTCSECVLDGYNLTYELGVAETYHGISEEKLHNLEDVDYNTLKTSWKIPQDKEFRITITNLTAYKPYKELIAYKEGINFLKEGTTQAPTGVSVFVKEWSDWVLTPEGRFEPVKIHVELW